MTPERNSMAVVGAGVAGLTAAWLLQRRGPVDLYEREPRLGGHTRTVELAGGPDRGTPVDTGFIVMNHRTYPLFTRLLQKLDVDLADSDMSFSFHDAGTGYAYAGTSLRSLFAVRRNLVDPGHWRMLADLLRFNRAARRDLGAGRVRDVTLGTYLARSGYSRAFADRYLLAMGGAIWSSPPARIEAFPAEAYLRFMENHGLLAVAGRPPWRYVKGGSRTYVERMMESFSGRVFTGAPVAGVRRHERGAAVRTADGSVRHYEAVVLAAHADESLAALEDPDPEERRLLGAWTYQENEAVLHTDASVMPPSPSAWASWNVAREAGGSGEDAPVSVTYHMNRLQRLGTEHDYFVSLNRRNPPRGERVADRTVFTHPVYTRAALDSQEPLRKRNGRAATYLCGSYLGYGFHEDAVRSAVEVAGHFGVGL